MAWTETAVAVAADVIAWTATEETGAAAAVFVAAEVEVGLTRSERMVWTLSTVEEAPVSEPQESIESGFPIMMEAIIKARKKIESRIIVGMYGSCASQ